MRSRGLGVELFLSEAQMGFRKGRGCTDASFVFRQLSEKVIEHNKHLLISNKVDTKRIYPFA